MGTLRRRHAWTIALAGCCAAWFWTAQATADEPTAVRTPTRASSKFPEWEKVVDGAKRLEGVFPLYYHEKDQKLFLELRQDQYEKEIILPIAIARGNGMSYLGGETLNFGEQWLISFRRAADRLLVIRRNVRFQADSGTPQADAVKVSYTDSVLKALPIKSEKNDGQLVLVDLADLLMSDLAGIGVQPDPSRSTWAKVKAFPKNDEIEVAAVFSAGSRGWSRYFSDDSVVDPRGTQVVIHYGLSLLPQSSSYRPRLADDRVGHFLSMVKDFSKDVCDTPNVRYVTRWNLEKEKPGAELSPPKQPIIFWIERTVPREYRQYVREGILEWNKAFAKVGIVDAIQARDQQADDDFDPEDIRYNTFRWIATSGGFAMGPSRTNPKTGEILDADIIFDESMVRYYRENYLRTVGLPDGLGLLAAGQRQAFFKLYGGELPALAESAPIVSRIFQQDHEQLAARAMGFPQGDRLAAPALARMACPSCLMGPSMQSQLELLSAVLAAKGDVPPGGKVPEKYIGQAIKEVVMHEVGHTLGLRHNFKASSSVSLADANNPAFTAVHGNSGSVMDYLPANIQPKGAKQGDYFSPTIGAYDYWAIEYAYKPIDGSEREELAKIASKVAADELTYGTDEDLFSNPDPRINAFDLGDPLDYAAQRFKLVRTSIDDLLKRVVAKGDGYQRARGAFARLIREMAQSTMTCCNYIGGEYTCRDHSGDPSARAPMRPIEIAKQREAIRLLEEEILSAKAFQFPPELLRYLAPDHWRDEFSSASYQYPLLKNAEMIQRATLSRLLGAATLRAIQEIGLHAEPGKDVLQMSEVFDACTNSVWSELPAADAKDGKPQKLSLTTLRRNLQREHVRQLSQMVLGPKMSGSLMDYLFVDFDEPAPADARSLARQHLRRIVARIERLTPKAKNAAPAVQLDAETQAHLEDLHDRIGKVLKAGVEMNDL